MWWAAMEGVRERERGARTRERTETSQREREQTVHCKKAFALSLSLSAFVPEPHFERIIAIVLLELGLEEPVFIWS